MKQQDIDRVYQIESLAHRTPWSRDILIDCVLVGYDCRILELDQQIIGYVICRYNTNTCHILNLCIDKAYQAQGYGKFLLKAVLDHLKKPGINTIVLEVRPSNAAALALYEKFAFQRAMIKKGYYKDADGEEDAILLKKVL